MFIVLIENFNQQGGSMARAVGPYKSYDLAKSDASAWGGRVVILEERIKAATDGAVLRGARQRR